MPINFPNSPADGASHTDGVTQWQYSASNHAWTVTNSSPVSLDNGTNHDTVMVRLIRSGGQNLLDPAVGLTYNETAKTLGIKGNVSQTDNFLEIKNSAGTVLNSFNQRGVLTVAGRIYYTGTTPTPNASDTGLLWYNTTNSNLYVWNGTTWVITSGGVDLVNNQTIAGAKTFSTNIFLSSTAAINGQGTSKSLVFKPTNSGSTVVTALTLTSADATFAVPVEFSAIGTTAKTVVATLADNQTLAGIKTFSDEVIAHTVSASTVTDGATSGNNLLLTANMATDGRQIKLYQNANLTNGILIRAKNKDNIGGLSIEGNTAITGNLSVSGTFSATNVAAVTQTFGQIASNSGTQPWNVNINPEPIGTLTFVSTTTGSHTSKGVTVTNSSTTQSAKFYVRRERSGDMTALAIHKVVLQPSTSMFVNATTGPVAGAGVTITYMGGDETKPLVLTFNNNPIRYEFSLAP